MSPDQARERANQIISALAAGADPEGAHGDQDQFYVDVLRDIVQAASQAWPRLMAEQALRVADAPGERWYA